MELRGIVFDLYGTLYDTGAVARACEHAFPTYGARLAAAWRTRQLEYTWLRSLMERYADFDAVTDDALRVCCAELGLTLDAATARRLGDAYRNLPLFADVAPSLRRLRDAGLTLAVLSNGTPRTLAQLIGTSGLHWAFDQVISADEARVFKPHRRVYQLAEQRTGLVREDMLYVSANSWDAAAAAHHGFPVCWVKRQDAPFAALGTTALVDVVDLETMTDWVLVQRVS